MLSPLMSAEAVCHHLQIQKTKFNELLKRGELEYVKVGRKPLVPEHSLAEFVQANMRNIGGSRVRRRG
jgi:excisionase family DNA binding protein